LTAGGEEATPTPDDSADDEGAPAAPVAGEDALPADAGPDP
jgi:hypothetical protein